MQWHKRIMYTFLLASKYFTRTLLLPPPHLSYCTEHNTKQDQSQQYAANRWSPVHLHKQRATFSSFLNSLWISLVFFFCFFVCLFSFPLWLFLFGVFARVSFSVLFFCAIGWITHAFSPLDSVAPSQSLITFFLQVTERFKGETPLGWGVCSCLS